MIYTFVGNFNKNILEPNNEGYESKNSSGPRVFNEDPKFPKDP